MSIDQEAILRAQWEKVVSDILDGFFSVPGRLDRHKITSASLEKRPSVNWPELAANELCRRSGASNLLMAFSDDVIVAIYRGHIDLAELLNQAVTRKFLGKLGN